MSQTIFNWRVAGAAGEGVKTTGMMFSKACLRHGFFTFDYTEYPSLIRGGLNSYQVTLSPQKVFSPNQTVDIHLALNLEGLKSVSFNLTPQTLVIFDSADLNTSLSDHNLNGIPVDLPMSRLIKEAGLDRVMINNVALGASVFFLGLDFSILNQVIADTFGPKKTDVIRLNQQAALSGYEYSQKHFKSLQKTTLVKQAPTDTHSLTGNEAISLGLIAGGLKFYAAYPMTPSSSILHTLADWQEKADIFVKHAEDEIGVINMCLGASYAGVRAACGTSGGGFCYMTEAVGLSGVSELPLVIIDSQRPGPALGMPTWTAQGDLLFTLFASQDEFPRIILAPGDVFEAFDLSRQALSLAERYQLPVIILSDKHLSESAESTHFNTTQFSVSQETLNPEPKTDETGFYPRYHLEPEGVSLRSRPGQPGGQYLSNSYEHDAHGIAAEDSATRQAQMSKRMQKLKTVAQIAPSPFFETSPSARATLVGWGSTKNALRAAKDLLSSQNIPVNLIHFSWLWPFPAKAVEDLLRSVVNPIIIEGNTQAQLSKLIRQETGIDIYHKRLKSDGRPFYPEEIEAWVKEIV